MRSLQAKQWLLIFPVCHIMQMMINTIHSDLFSPDILNSKKATEIFLRENSIEAKKILAVEEITSEKLKDIPYEMLAKELSKRMMNMSVFEFNHLRDDPDYSEKLNSLRNVCDDIYNTILSEIDGV